jgi:hypothetical protein
MRSQDKQGPLSPGRLLLAWPGLEAHSALLKPVENQCLSRLQRFNLTRLSRFLYRKLTGGRGQVLPCCSTRTSPRSSLPFSAPFRRLAVAHFAAKFGCDKQVKSFLVTVIR